MVLDGEDWKAAVQRHRCEVQEGYVRAVLAKYRDAGMTYVRDGGDNCGACLLASKIAPEYGIEYRMPVFALHRRGRYGSIVGFSFGDLADFRRMMRDAVRKGADFIKIMVSGIMDFREYGRMSCESLSAEEIRALVETVHEAGLAAMLHINGREACLAAIEAGADSLEHGAFMDDECLAALAEHRGQTVWVPTVAPAANQIGCGRYPDEVLQKIARGQQERIRKAVRLGARVALGSDAGAHLVPHVQGAWDEYGYLREALAPDLPEEAILAMLRENEDWIRRRFRVTARG